MGYFKKINLTCCVYWLNIVVFACKLVVGGIIFAKSRYQGHGNDSRKQHEGVGLECSAKQIGIGNIFDSFAIKIELNG